MDYTLAALKLFCSQLNNAKEINHNSQPAFSLRGILFQRAWLQGIIISTPTTDPTSGRFLLDDGTGIVELCLFGDFLTIPWEIGMYVMVVGGFSIRKGDIPLIKVHKIVDLSPFPYREAMWYLEVVEVFNLFYQPLFEE